MGWPFLVKEVEQSHFISDGSSARPSENEGVNLIDFQFWETTTGQNFVQNELEAGIWPGSKSSMEIGFLEGRLLLLMRPTT